MRRIVRERRFLRRRGIDAKESPGWFDRWDMRSTHRWRTPAAILIMTTALSLLASSCQSADDASVATAPASSAEEAPTLGPTATPTGTVGVPAAEDEPRDMAPGPWFSSAYSQSLAFDLPVRGRLVDQGLGWTTIAVGDPATGTHGLIRVVEAVAFSSPNGPIPISLIGPESEFGDTVLLARGTASSPRGELRWRDVVTDGALVPQQFQKPCGFDPAETCVDAPITEGGPVLIEVDRPTRFIGQPFGSRKLYVIATALGSDHDSVLDQAFHIAASIVTTDRTDSEARRPLATLGTRADTLPAGSWFVDLGDVTVDLAVTEDLAGVSILDTGATWFALQTTTDDGEEMIFSVQVFQGFPDGALIGDDVGTELPLPADVFLRGIDTIAPIGTEGPAMVGGYPSRFYEEGDPPVDSPFACTAIERRDLEPDESCVVFSIDGWRYIDSADRRHEYQHQYVEELGVIVVYGGVPGVDGFVVEPVFELLLDGLDLTGS